MVSNNPMAVLGAKNVKADSAKKPSKKPEQGFNDELINREKKLKKKDPREAVAVQQQPEVRRDASAPQTDDKAPAPQQQKTQSIERTSAQSTGVVQQTPQNQAAAAQQGVETAAADQAAVVQMNAQNAVMQAMNTEGSLDLAGMQLQNPQVFAEALASVEAAMTAETPASSEVSAEGNEFLRQALESLSAFEGMAGQKESMNKDSAEGEAALLDLGAQTQANVPMKENQQTDFTKLLETKAAQVTDSVKQANVDNVITHAKTILKDGGGEMQVKLTPDGMGTIDLRIAVNKGNVSVEIMTQDESVRKMFEDSIFDIRGSLEAQNLKVDGLKVGVSQNLEQQMQQFNMAEREFARDFMNQFRDERQAFRGMAVANKMDNPSMSPKQPEGLSPASQRPFPSGTGRLNVVI